MRTFTLSSLFMVFFCCTAIAGNKYISPTGSDSSGDGSLANPYATINYASSSFRSNPVVAGDTLFLMGGTYFQTDKINATNGGGTALNPIVLMPYDGQSVTFDGIGITLSDTQSMIFNSQDYVIIDGITVQNSDGRGISYYHAQGTIIRNCTVHDVDMRAIGGSGHDVIMEDNLVYNAVMQNENEWFLNSGSPDSWSGSIQAIPYPNDATYNGVPSQNVIVRNNIVYDCWGEGILMNTIDGGMVSGNVVSNCYSVLMYIDRCQNIEIKQNYIYASNDLRNKNQGTTNEKRPNGITFANEDHHTGVQPNAPTHDMIVHNNIVAGSHRCLSYWHDTGSSSVYNTYQDIFIYYNVFYDADIYTIQFDNIETPHNAPSNVVIKNNIIFDGANGNNISFGNGYGLVTFSNNNWPDGIPSSGTHTNSISSDPLFVSPSAGGAATGFKLQNGSPCIGAGTPISNLTIDYWGNPRHGTTPAIGIEADASLLSVIINPFSNVSCNGDNDGSATATAGGGSGSYTYSWSNGASTAMISGLSPGIYTVTVNDGLSTANTSVTITNPSVVSVAISGTNATGGNSNGSATATGGGGTPGYTYSWSNGGNGTTITGLAPATYFVTTTDVNGCTGTGSVVISNSTTTTTTFIPYGAGWEYYDNGYEPALQGTLAWFDNNYDDSAWQSGNAHLGYGDGDETTVVTDGIFTCYVRNSFNVVNALDFDNLDLNLTYDDGAVVYLNGTEIWRVNMPTGLITYNTFADGGSSDNAEISTNISNALINGVNVLAVEIHQVSAGSSDISFDFELIANPAGGTINVERGPYLQKASPTSMVVRWRTSTATESVIDYGSSFGNLTLNVSDLTPKTEHEIEITGLSPNTTYYYQIGNLSTTLIPSSSDLYFKTSPASGAQQAITAWILGDCGTANNNQRAVRDAYYSYIGANHTDMMLFLGDNAYEDGTDEEYQYALFENMYENKLKNTIAWSCLGNHDGHSANSSTQMGPYYDIFTFPTAGESGGVASGTEAYYSFDYGNIHFISLDSHESDRDVGSAMYNWCENDIQNTTAEWIVAIWHHPPYSKGSHDSDSEMPLVEMRQNFVPMLESNGVDLVLSGHSHSYERSYLLNGHYGDSGTFNIGTHTVGNTGSGDGQVSGTGAYEKVTSGAQAGDGAVYITAGSSGKKSSAALNHNAMHYSVAELGSCILEVNGNQMDVKFIRETGSIEDFFTIVKDPVLSCTVGDPCNDGDPCTINDIYDNSCNCVGTIQDSDGDGVCDANDQCPGTNDNLIGTACDDLNACTINDIYDNTCNCVGTFADSDGDGVCDANDQCPGTDDNLIGTACDDLNDCTINDVYDANCNCTGTNTAPDSDGDGICDANDQCPGTDDNIIGTACDDGDPCTINDIYDNTCNCAGTYTDADGDGYCVGNDPDDNDGCYPDPTSPACNSCFNLITDGFEVDFGNWNDGGEDCYRLTSNGNSYITLRDNSGDHSSMFTGDLDMSVYNEATVDFTFSADDVESGEDFFLEISTDGGGNYTIYEDWISGTDFEDYIIYNESVSVTGITFTANTRFRFRCDASGNSDYIFIDDVSIKGCDLNCTPGNACDDGDPCTTLDIYDNYCNCAGTFQDADSDGVCDANDQCPGTDDNIIGTVCDDLDPCTINDVYDNTCSCAGTYTDADGDGYCVGNDPDDTDSCNPDPLSPSCCTVMVTDDFETGFVNWNDGGDDCYILTSNGNSYITIRDNSGDNSSMFTNDLDMSLYDGATIDFIFSADDVEAGEDFFLEISTDGGSTYTIYEDWISGIDFEDYIIYNESVSITGIPFTGNTRFRFRCDASGNSDYIFIDDVTIEGCDLNCTPGNACDDGDPCTISDIYDSYCNCAGTYQDSDGDGVCDGNDQCPGTDDNIIGTACDDLDLCTINDVYDNNCNCVGTYTDVDGDGYCIGNDPDDNDGCNPDLNSSVCCTALITDDFEVDFGNWNDGGGDCYRSTSNGMSYITIRDNSGASSSMFTSDLDMSVYNEAAVDFIFSTYDMETGEDFFLEISTDGGSTYTIYEDWISGTDFVDNTLYTETVIVTGITFTANTRFRFRCDASSNSDQVYIDDVAIQGCSPAPSLMIVLNDDNEVQSAGLDLELSAEPNIEFFAKKVPSGQVELHWTVQTAQDYSLTYVLEHSTDNRQFTTIVAHNQLVNQAFEYYEELHFNPQIGENYYRLKVIHPSSDIEYLYANKVIIESLPKSIKVFPNPTTGKLYVDLSEVLDRSGSISIYNLQGIQIYNLDFNASHERIIELDLNYFQNGIYSFYLIAPGERFMVQKIVILK